MYRQGSGWGLYAGETITASGDDASPFRSSQGYDFRLSKSSSKRTITVGPDGRRWARSRPVPWADLGRAVIWLVTFGTVKIPADRDKGTGK